jgi:hypothetical protein
MIPKKEKKEELQSRMFPWLDDWQSKRLIETVDKLGITDTSEKLKKQQEIYKEVLPQIKAKEAQMNRQVIKNEQYNATLDTKDPKQKAVKMAGLKMEDLADMIKEKYDLDPNAPTDWIISEYNTMLNDMGIDEKLVEDYMNGKSDELLYATELKARPEEVVEEEQKISPVLEKWLEALDSYNWPLKSVVKWISSYIRWLTDSANLAWEWLKNIDEKWKEINLQAVKNDVTEALFMKQFWHQFDPSNKDDVVKAKTITNVEDTQEYKNYLSRLQWEQSKIDESSTSANILDVAQGTLWVWFSTFAPQTMLWMNIAGQTKVWWSLLEWFWSIIEQWWSVINMLPWLKQFKESLPEDKREEFDSYIGNMAFMLVVWAKWKKNIVKDPMKFIKDNANPAEIIQNFQEVILWIPKSTIKWVSQIPEKTSNFFKKSTEWVDNVDRIASNVFGLDAETVSTMRKNPEILKKIDEWTITKEWIKEDLIKMVEEVQEQKWEVGGEYQKLYEQPNTFSSVKTQNTLRTNLESKWVKFDDSWKITWFDITNKALANTPQWELWLIKSQYNMLIDSLSDKWQLNVEQMHTIKRTLNNARYSDWVLRKKSPILQEMSDVINNQLKEVEWRKETDLKFTTKAKELQELADLIVNNKWEFKWTLKALLWERQYARLVELEKLYPWLTKKLETIKAYDDYIRTRETKKVWDYGKLARAGAWWWIWAWLWYAIWWTFGMYLWWFLWSLITNHLTDPKVFKDYIIKNVKDWSKIVEKMNKWQQISTQETQAIIDVLQYKKDIDGTNTTNISNTPMSNNKPTQWWQKTSEKSIPVKVETTTKPEWLAPTKTPPKIPTKNESISRPVVRMKAPEELLMAEARKYKSAEDMIKWEQLVDTKGLKIRMRDLQIADKNLKLGKPSITPDAPVEITYNITDWTKELTDWYHRYLQSRWWSIEKAMENAKNWDFWKIKAKIKYVREYIDNWWHKRIEEVPESQLKQIREEANKKWLKPNK